MFKVYFLYRKDNVSDTQLQSGAALHLFERYRGFIDLSTIGIARESFINTERVTCVFIGSQTYLLLINVNELYEAIQAFRNNSAHTALVTGNQ